jgi:hypothetical protein
MTKRLTKTVNGQRVMRELPLWTNLNEKSHLKWFKKHETFFVALSREIGFTSIEVIDLETLNDSHIIKLTITHKEGKVFKFNLIRLTNFLGGGVSFVGVQEPIYLTSKYYANKSTLGESRTEIGNWFLSVLRDNWST